MVNISPHKGFSQTATQICSQGCEPQMEIWYIVIWKDMSFKFELYHHIKLQSAKLVVNTKSLRQSVTGLQSNKKFGANSCKTG